MRIHPPPVAVYKIMCKERYRQQNLWWWSYLPIYKKIKSKCRLCNGYLYDGHICREQSCYMGKYSDLSSYDSVVTSALEKNTDYNNLVGDPVKAKGIFAEFLKNNPERVKYKSNGKIDMVEQLGGWYNVKYISKGGEVFGNLNKEESIKYISKEWLDWLSIGYEDGDAMIYFINGEARQKLEQEIHNL